MNKLFTVTIDGREDFTTVDLTRVRYMLYKQGSLSIVLDGGSRDEIIFADISRDDAANVVRAWESISAIGE